MTTTFVNNSNNPLLDLSTLPQYASVKPEHINPALDTLLANASAAIAAAENITEPSWDSLAVLEDPLEQLGRAWGVIGHLESVVNTPELRDAYNSNIPRISNFFTELGQNEKLFALYKAVKEREYAALSPTRKVIIDDAIRGFVLSGAELPAEQKNRFKDIEEKLSELTTRFSQNVLDATDDFALYVTKDELAGLPDDNLAAAAAQAAADGKTDLYKITLKMPSYLPVMQYVQNRALREQLYKAYVTRASEFGKADWDNGQLIPEILALRQESAQLLGHENFGETSLVTKMADSPEQVISFLKGLAVRAKPYMLEDRAELEAFAKAEFGIEKLEAWDLALVSERLREQKYSFSEQEVKQYFTEPTVLAGLFKLISELYGLQFVPAQAPVWHTDVQYFELKNNDGSLVGGLYMDLHAREGKQGGAWMNDVRGRKLKADGTVQTPVALIVCNFASGVDGKDAMLPHDDVITLFHEMGHALHHLLTEVDELEVSGISGVEWDAVELPSQFMENFAWEWQVLPALTKHIETSEAIPRPLFDKMLAAKNFHSGSGLQRQLYFSIFDMALHQKSEAVSAGDLTAFAQAVQQELALPLPPEYNRFPQSFSHIFAGGYAAGYYSYKWAEVLSADAYAAFEEAADQTGSSVVNPAVGARFRKEILAVGGSRPAAESFAAFRGRAPAIDALLRHNGLSD
ncbi:M3 family metallopeptidase [Chitinibacter bivalviorum]|uniref:oligopeptidase A n=1 Tax=Chitinibacter bivalviorum TaxID=2739434 RepID=A0A7H9BF52_9NEIS|nr:M3 family metallopeptidase [Chitinibacter bivalviorum]QLG87249.1 M3 family metallopeptidase [Chitinibacter bivalviorum]